MPTVFESHHRQVAALAYDGLCTFEFGVAVEAFGLARPEMGEDWYRFAVAGVDEGPLRATGGVRVVVDGGLELLESAGTIIVPGWRGADAPVPEDLILALRSAHQRGARLLSICSGVFVLAAAGLLAGKRATTHWRYAEALARRFPDIAVEPDALYVDNGDVLTSAGSAAGIDLCLHLIRRDYGAAAANSVARRLVAAPHRDGGQAQFIERSVPEPRESGRVSRALDLMRSDLSKERRIAELADAAGMSARTFLRRFEAATGATPARWLRAERLAKAKELLETTDRSIDEIARLCGFNDLSSFRGHFRTAMGTTPSSYRALFGSPGRAARTGR